MPIKSPLIGMPARIKQSRQKSEYLGVVDDYGKIHWAQNFDIERNTLPISLNYLETRTG